MSNIVGECGKHPGFNFVNCPRCAIEEQIKFSKDKKYYAVEYAGYWHIQRSPYYGGNDILNAEDVGEKEAEANAKRIADLLNQGEGPQRSVASKTQSELPKPETKS